MNFADEPLVFVDLETTGANPLRDRITEIGIVQVQGDRVESWSSLVNPDVAIPPFIQNLTGISNEMVASAPHFDALAQAVLAKLEGRLFIAHNARFDYGFLKNEFKRIGMPFQSRVLCTVQLSRKLYPLEHKHNLDALSSRHALAAEGERHRALTDAELIRQFILVATRELGGEVVQAAVSELTRLPPWPMKLDAAMMDDLPEAPGVFVCYGAERQALLVCNAKNIRKEVLAYFSGKKQSKRPVPLVEITEHLEWFEAAGEFGAALIEQQLLARLQPIYNNPQPVVKESSAWAWRGSEARLGYVLLDEGLPNVPDLFGPFRSRREAVQMLTRQAEAQGLCKVLLGLEDRRKDNPACIGLALGKCKGACIGREALSSHYARMLSGLSCRRFPTWPHRGPIGLAEGPDWAPALHIFDQWVYLGTIHDISELPAKLAEPRPPFDAEMMKLIRSLFKKREAKLIKF